MPNERSRSMCPWEGLGWPGSFASFIGVMLAFFTVPWSAAQKEQAENYHSEYSLEEYVQGARETLLDTTADYELKYDYSNPYRFVDMSAQYNIRIDELHCFLKLEDEHAYRMLLRCFGHIFVILYTRGRSMNTILGACLIFLILILALVSVVLFATSHKDGHNEKDIMVTYILFCCTTMLEFLFPCWHLCLQAIPCLKQRVMKDKRKEVTIPQYNLISFCVRKKNPTFLMKLLTFNFLRELSDQHWYIQRVPENYEIARLVRHHVEYGWKTCIHNTASYKRFNDSRGQGVIRRHPQLAWSLKKPFCESVLIWHIATDICFYHTFREWTHEQEKHHSMKISNYMIYLLVTHPEMLMPGTVSGLFTLSSDAIVERSMLHMTEETLAQEILCMEFSTHASSTVRSAVKLAYESIITIFTLLGIFAKIETHDIIHSLHL